MTDVSVLRRSGLVARTRMIDARHDLLDHLGRGGFAWLNAEGGFVTSGTTAVIAAGDATDFLRALPHERDRFVPATAGPRAVGAMPFDGKGELVVPAVLTAYDADGRAWQTVVHGTGVDGLAPQLRVAAPGPARFTVEACMSADQWRAAVIEVLGLIAAGTLEKVVLARAVRVEADRPFDPGTVIAELRRMQPGCTIYAAGNVVGATPELLVRKRGTAVMSRPLAGTGSDPAHLLASTKDAREHDIVVAAVRERLAVHCDAVHSAGPSPLGLTDLTHLATTVSARCESTHTSVVDLARALHPTPAVAGTPRSIALDVIRRLEPQRRGKYAGPCGWVDARGDGDFVVALRCGTLDGASALLHAGAGIVAGSDPDAEWFETQQKLEPMLRALVRP